MVFKPGRLDHRVKGGAAGSQLEKEYETAGLHLVHFFGVAVNLAFADSEMELEPDASTVLFPSAGPARFWPLPAAPLDRGPIYQPTDPFHARSRPQSFTVPDLSLFINE